MFKYLELLSELEQLIAQAHYRGGQRLPSIRELSQRHGVNKSTVIRALGELEARHQIYSVPQSGYYVVKSETAAEEEGGRRIHFGMSAPDPEMFPYLDFRHCVNKAIDTYQNDLFMYGTAKGLPSLIAALQKQFAEYQVFASARQIFVTSGVQQALSVLTKMPFPNGKTEVLIEQPGYHLFIEQLETYGVPAVGIRRTAEGIDLEELERIFRTRSIKFFYTIPRLHSPLGTAYTDKQKRRIVDLAAKYDVYVAEDDYMADLEMNKKADPLYAYDTKERVIYLKSYSKIIFPGLRLGAVVVPDALEEDFNRFKRVQDVDSPMLSQAALEIYMKNGMFERHRQKIRAAYGRRSKLLASALRDSFGSGSPQTAVPATAEPYIHTHLIVSPQVFLDRALAQLRKQGVDAESAARHYLTGFRRDKLLKLNISQVRDDEVERGVRLIAEALAEAGR